MAAPQQNEIVHLRERFSQDTKDEVWLGELGAEGDWIVVSGDPRFSRGKVTKPVWRNASLTTFFLGKGWMNQRFWVQAPLLVKWWPTIVLEAKTSPAGTGFEIPLRGATLKTVYEPSLSFSVKK